MLRRIFRTGDWKRRSCIAVELGFERLGHLFEDCVGCLGGIGSLGDGAANDEKTGSLAQGF